MSRGRYGFALFFQLKTHTELGTDNESAAVNGERGGEGGEEEGTEGPALTLLGALSVLTAITVLVALASECVSNARSPTAYVLHPKFV